MISIDGFTGHAWTEVNFQSVFSNSQLILINHKLGPEYKHTKQCFFKRFDDNSVAFGFVHQFFCVFSYYHFSIWERKFLIFWSGTIWPCSQYTVLLVYSSFGHTDCYNSVKECDMGECTDDKTCCHTSSARYTPLHLIGVFYHLVLVFFKSSIHVNYKQQLVLLNKNVFLPKSSFSSTHFSCFY